jgi:quinol monooxygenase YgiN
VDGHLTFFAEATVKDGQLDAFEELVREMVEGTSAEPQTLAYEWYVSDDGRSVNVLEKYADSDAFLSHAEGFLAKWAGRMMECVDITRFVVGGDPSPAVRELLDGFGATYARPWGGFSRFS